MRGSDKDRVCANSVHEYANGRLQIVKMNIAIFCHKVDDIMFWRVLKIENQVEWNHWLWLIVLIKQLVVVEQKKLRST